MKKNHNSSFIIHNSKGGFTLVEMLVATAVFTVVMTVTLAAILNITDIQKKISARRVVQENLNFAFDVMVREIRTGKNYNNQSDGNVEEFPFTNAQGQDVVYRINASNQLERSEDGGFNFLPLTDPKLNIENLNFVVNGAGSGDSRQPMVIITLAASAGEKEKLITRINLQTTVSQRAPDS
jgi:prepilin-type N-terminal cleavage/methylation domain-containing protein